MTGTVKVTPLRTANVPPPMALHEINVPSPACDVALNSSGSRIAVLCSKEILLCHYDPTQKSKSALFLAQALPLKKIEDSIAKQICFIGEELCVLYYGKHSENDSICIGARTLQVQDKNNITRIAPSLDGKTLHLLCGCDVVHIMLSRLGADVELQDHVETQRTCTFPEPVLSLDIATIGDRTVAFGLTSTAALYANEMPVLRGCTSYVVTPSFLVVTTTQHLLKFIHLSSFGELEVPPDAPETDERCRNIERGAKLVSVMPTSFAVVLQLPRGNLETVYPRALVLASIRRDVEKQSYRTAFLTCRSQRVDMNILHDLAPEQFIMSAEEILTQLGRTDYMDLLLSQLRYGSNTLIGSTN